MNTSHENGYPLALTFDAVSAVACFERHTGVALHPTVAGQLLARRGRRAVGSHFGRQVYPRNHWRGLWGDLLALWKSRARYDALLPEAKDVACPPCPKVT
jgi:hypothetical protein